VFVADAVREQRREQGRNSNLLELGVVQELTQKLKLVAGVRVVARRHEPARRAMGVFVIEERETNRRAHA
jgi:hypothetical protein